MAVDVITGKIVKHQHFVNFNEIGHSCYKFV